MWLRIRIKPLSPSLFRRPTGVFEASVHGPAAGAVSLSYPMPSTIAGMLAGTARQLGLCSPSSAGDYEDQMECLQALFGEGFALRPGLASAGGRLYAYLGVKSLVEVGALKRAMRRVGVGRLNTAHTAGLREEALGEAGSRLEIAFTSHIGVALDRHSKSAAEGMLYRAQLADYTSTPGRPEVIVYARSSTGDMGIKTLPTPLGGDAKTAIVKAQPAEETPRELLVDTQAGNGGSGKWLLTLLTPALLEETPLPLAGSGEPVTIGEEAAETLGKALLRESSASECHNAKLSMTLVPRGELELEIVNPGWSRLEKRPRRPHLLVPPGSIGVLEGAGPECINKLAEEGIGAHSRLGWGTVVAARLY
ncbi:CRISPR-associated protein [Aeropyrum pernix]|uniref:CRISPR-associated protein n=1 Tax=Aeropyrum pernix TaxID=56636 RepID=A0A401H7K3_AERPX|nr:type III-B CRISPR module-associated Cmr3 family protein [Aeropyrum pernix]GBF08394.1 CRISPR-associated protein [Aeropyrum pernix]